MKKLYLTIFSLLILSATSFAQEYDINSYDFRYQKYKGFTLNPSLNSNGGNSFSNYDFPNSMEPTGFNNNSRLNGNLSLNANYFSVINVVDLQENISISGGDHTSWLWGKDLNSNGAIGFQRNVANKLNLTFSKTTRMFDSEVKFKYRASEMSGNLNASHEFFESNRVNGFNAKKQGVQTLNGTIAGSIGRGKGRINPVGDVILAHFLLEDLYKKLGTKYTNSQLENLAHGITYIRNQRYLDYRFRTIDQLTALDSTLASEGLRDANNIAFFTTLNDNWNYATNLGRASGKQWTYYFTQGVSTNGYREKNYLSTNLGDTLLEKEFKINFSNIHSLLPSYTVSYYSAIQKSWKVQQSFSASATVGSELSAQFGRGTSSDSAYLKPDRNLSPNYRNRAFGNVIATWEHLYQPNSRTYYTASISPSINFNDLRSSDSLLQNWNYTNNYFQPSLRTNFRYYKWFNQNLAFTSQAYMNIGLARSNSKPWLNYGGYSQNTTSMDYGFSAGFTYQLY